MRYSITFLATGDSRSRYHSGFGYEASSAWEAVEKMIAQDPSVNTNALLAQRDGGVAIVSEYGSVYGTMKGWGVELFEVAPRSPATVTRQLSGRL